MVCRIKNRHTFKSLPILNSAYFTECRFVIRHITQTDTETETEANFTHTGDNHNDDVNNNDTEYLQNSAAAENQKKEEVEGERKQNPDAEMTVC